MSQHPTDHIRLSATELVTQLSKKRWNSNGTTSLYHIHSHINCCWTLLGNNVNNGVLPYTDKNRTEHHQDKLTIDHSYSHQHNKYLQ